MFVKNLSDSTLEFKKNGRVLKIKPGVNIIDVLKWDIQDIRNTYGSNFLAFYTEDDLEAPEETNDEEETKDADNNDNAPVEDEGKKDDEPVTSNEGEQFDGILVNADAKADDVIGETVNATAKADEQPKADNATKTPAKATKTANKSTKAKSATKKNNK